MLTSRRAAPILIVLLLGACKPRPYASDDDARCGDPPELPYACAGGAFPCECHVHADGTAQWHCDECPPVDCAAAPTDPLCAKDASCIRCHGLASAEDAVGIENAHPWAYLGCVECHGGTGVDPGDPAHALGVEESHVHIPHEIAQSGSITTPDRTAYENYYLAHAGVERLEGGLEWLRFVNPGDLRVVDQTCGRTGCHPQTALAVKNSVMTTVVGKLDAMLYAVGIPRAGDLAPALGDDSYGKKLATFASVHAEDPTWDPATAPPGSVPHVHALETVDRETERPFGTYSEEDIYKESINKLCGTCHLGHNGKNDQYGTFRSSGCTACHMPYDWSG
jgi:hypothetical protein